MVRNWQSRVELAEARKRATKQKKQRSEDKRLSKAWFQELLAQMDRYDDAVRQRRSTLHVWTDLIPSSSVPLLDLLVVEEHDSTNKASKRRDKGRGGEKGRPRSDSNPEHGKKKAHPRSKEAPQEEEADSGSLLLCRSSFLTGKCENKGKKGGCRYLHNNPRFKTLGAALGDSLDQKLLSLIEASLIDSQDQLLASNPGAMEMLYHTQISLPTTGDEPLSKFVAERLAENETPVSSACYVALNGVLVFDRFRGGILLDEREFFGVVADVNTATMDRRTSSVGSELSGEYDTDDFLTLPSTILEHILLFLPDTAVAAAAQACKAWYHEIGQHSPNLWHQLLERRGWPIPQEKDDDDDGRINRQKCRSSFMEHYMVLRDVRALSAATLAVVSRQTVPEIEMAYQDYSRRKHAPQSSDDCVGIHQWSEKRVLVAYGEECSLRLFETTRSADNGELRCKELVYQSVSPYKNTRKRNCQLVAVGVDENNVGCLCSVSSDYVSGIADILVVLSRDEFLVGTSSDALSKGGATESAELKVIDIGESVLNFVLSSFSHRLLPLFDYLNGDGEIGNIIVKTSKGSLCACGFGRFMVEVSISMPTPGDLETEENETILLDRKLVLFSATVGAITWAGESYPLERDIPDSGEAVNLAVLRQRSACMVASRSLRSPDILVADIDASGEIHPPRLIEASVVARSAITKENFNLVETRGLLVTPSDVVALDVLVQQEENEPVTKGATVLQFYPHYASEGQVSYDLLRLPEGYVNTSTKLHPAGDNYVVAFCSLVKPPPERPRTEAEEVAGQWFTETETTVESKFVAFVVHVPSRSVIGRVDFKTDNYGLELAAGRDGSTMGLAIDGRGVAITGSSIRASQTSFASLATASSKKKKKASRTKRASKEKGHKAIKIKYK